MPVLFYLFVFLGSLGLLIYVVSRRTKIIKKALNIQKELETQRKKAERAQKKERLQKRKALKQLQQVSEQKQQSLRNIGAVNELLKKVDHDLSTDNQDAALKTLIEILSLDENHRKANELIAKIYLSMGQYKKAELICKRLISHFPFDANYYAYLAQSCFQRHQFKVATEHYQKALELDKNNPDRYIDLGHVYNTRKDYKTALEYYVKAHRLNVRDTELLFLIIDTCLHNSDPISAREYLHKVLDYEPYNQQAKEMLAEVLHGLKEAA